MARRILFLLLVIMTLQLSWSVVTAYCMHETGRSANHLGHHQHNSSSEELSLATKDEQPITKKSTAHDVHCASYTHLALAVPDSITPPNIGRVGLSIPVGALASPASIFPSPPERPQWISRA